MNIYWFQSSDKATQHVIMASSVSAATYLLTQVEQDIESEEFALVGVNYDINQSSGGEIAEIVEMEVKAFSPPRTVSS